MWTLLETGIIKSICLLLLAAHALAYSTTSRRPAGRDDIIHFVEMSTPSNAVRYQTRGAVNEHFEKKVQNSSLLSEFYEELERDKQSVGNTGNTDVLSKISNKLDDLKRRFTSSFTSSNPSTNTHANNQQASSEGWFDGLKRRLGFIGKKETAEEVRHREIQTFLAELDREIQTVDHRLHNTDQSPVVDLTNKSPSYTYNSAPSSRNISTETVSDRRLIDAPQRCSPGTRRDISGQCRVIARQ